MVLLEDSQEAFQMSETYAAISSDSIGATPAVSAGATFAISASARFPCPMVPSWLRHKPVSNNLNKILALVSTQLLQKFDKNDNNQLQLQLQLQKQKQKQKQKQQKEQPDEHDDDVNHIDRHW